jgi:glycosyltransferase involved in cell wall biosynthesis
VNKKKIAIIAHGCRTGGTLVSTPNLLRAIKNVAEHEEILLVCSEGCGYEQIELPSGSRRYIYKWGHSPVVRQWFERVTLPKIIDAYNPDVIFGPGNIGLTKPKAPQAILIRIAYLFYDRKKYYPNATIKERMRLAALRNQVKTSLVNGTNLVFVQTPVVRERVAAAFDYPITQIKVLRLPPPADIRFPSDDAVPSVFRSGENDFNILIMTPYMTHRNPDVLIPLCRNYCRQLREQHIRFITTITSGEHRYAERFLKNISRYGFEDIILNVGELSRSEVTKYLTNSQLLWLPTMIETLCFPFLEAMALGTSVMAPDLDFARYVCGNAAIFYDPWDIDSIFRDIMLVRENAALRKELVEKGKAQLGDRKIFAGSWEETATDLIHELRTLAEQV